MKSTGQSENKLSDSMTFSDHLEELRQRILNSIYSILVSIFFSFLIIKPLISFLEIPAVDIHLLQLAPGEFLFVAIKVAGYSGLIVSMPYIFLSNNIIHFSWFNKTRKKPYLACSFWFGFSIFFRINFFMVDISPCSNKFLH